MKILLFLFILTFNHSILASIVNAKHRVVDMRCNSQNPLNELQLGLMIKVPSLRGEGKVELAYRFENPSRKKYSQPEYLPLTLLSSSHSAFSLIKKISLASDETYTHLSFYFVITPLYQHKYIDRGESIDRSLIRFFGENRYVEDPAGNDIIRAYQTREENRDKTGFEYGHYRIKLRESVCYKQAGAPISTDISRVVY